MFKVNQKVKYSVNDKYYFASVQEVYRSGDYELTNGHLFNKDGLHFDYYGYVDNNDGSRVKLEIAE